MKGKVVLVTGASKGIGKAIALACAQAGADVAVNYSGSKEAADEVVKEIQEKGQKAVAIQANVGKEEDVQALIEKTKTELGRLDGVVNNAGITKDRTLKNMSNEEWDDVLQVNLKGAFYVCKHALPAMEDGGAIVNVSSVVGISGNFGQANYAAAKAGMIGLTKSLAKEGAKRGIRVNSVAPGFIETEMTKKIPLTKKMGVKMLIPGKEFGKPEDVAHPTVFLLSDKARYITGQVLKVDGGMMF